MRRVATWAIGLLAGAVAAGCGDSSCGGPISDLPSHCGSSSENPYGGQGSTAGDVMDAGENPASGDGNLGAGDAGTVSVGGGTDAGCILRTTQCTGAVQALDVRGTSPFGEAHVKDVALVYVGPLGLATELRFHGTFGGARASLDVQIPLPSAPVDEDAPWVVPPGVYGPTDAGFPMPSATWSTCARQDSLGVSVEISEHEAVSMRAGGTGHLAGTLHVTEAGWLLTIPFDITRACALESNEP